MMAEKTAVSILQEYLVKNSKIIPQYELVNSSSYTTKVWFKYKLAYQHHEVIGEGPSKKEAKQNTAKAMIEKLSIDCSKKLQSPRNVNSVKSQFNAIGALTEFCVKNKYPQANYVVVTESGPPHKKEFTIKCTVGEHSSSASAFTKQDAKHVSADELLQKLKGIHITVEPEPVQTNLSTDISTTNENNVSSNTISDEEKVKRKEIIEKFRATSTSMKLAIVKKNTSDLVFKDYHTIFKLDSNISSNILTSLAFMVREHNVNRFESILENSCQLIFSKLLEEMGLKQEFIEVLTFNSSYRIVVLNINYSIPLSFVGKGDSLTEAKEEAMLNAVRCFTRLYI